MQIPLETELYNYNIKKQSTFYKLMDELNYYKDVT